MEMNVAKEIKVQKKNHTDSYLEIQMQWKLFLEKFKFCIKYDLPDFSLEFFLFF